MVLVCYILQLEFLQQMQVVIPLYNDRLNKRREAEGIGMFMHMCTQVCTDKSFQLLFSSLLLSMCVCVCMGVCIHAYVYVYVCMCVHIYVSKESDEAYT